jgi:hypothetical protein
MRALAVLVLALGLPAGAFGAPEVLAAGYEGGEVLAAAPSRAVWLALDTRAFVDSLGLATFAAVRAG